MYMYMEPFTYKYFHMDIQLSWHICWQNTETDIPFCTTIFTLSWIRKKKMCICDSVSGLSVILVSWFNSVSALQFLL